jgi:hypothetical protein
MIQGVCPLPQRSLTPLIPLSHSRAIPRLAALARNDKVGAALARNDINDFLPAVLRASAILRELRVKLIARYSIPSAASDDFIAFAAARGPARVSAR